MTKHKRDEGPEVSRRDVLQGLGVAAASAALGCGSVEAVLGGAGGAGGAGATAGPGSQSSTQSSSASSGGGGAGQGGQGGEGGVGPAACDDDGGLSAAELLAPIDTIVVLMMENRSFDHYLGGSLGIVEARPDIVGLTGSETNPAPGGGVVQVHHLTTLTPASPPHGWTAVHNQWNQGSNDGFVIEHEGDDQDQVMGYYLRGDVPVHHALADAHVICNHSYCSVLGPTWPNRFHLHGATSNGMMSNDFVGDFEPLWGPAKAAGMTVKNYHHGIPWATGGYGKLDSDLASFSSFKQAAQAGTLPNFSIIDPLYFGFTANDDHPSNGDIPLAQLLISDVYTALAESPQWNRCLLIVTYDEHGGFYDHVPPPPTTDPDYPAFAQLGFRVPTLVAGPYVRRGCAVNTVFDHCSVLATLSTRWGVTALNARHAAAADYSSAIDPNYVKARAPQPPAMMPRLTVSLSALRERRIVEPQHPELIESLKQQGLYRRLWREQDSERQFRRHLDDCVRKGIARVIA
jgi:phospholipase C